jgi:hypothetical protein
VSGSNIVERRDLTLQQWRFGRGRESNRRSQLGTTMTASGEALRRGSTTVAMSGSTRARSAMPVTRGDSEPSRHRRQRGPSPTLGIADGKFRDSARGANRSDPVRDDRSDQREVALDVGQTAVVERAQRSDRFDEARLRCVHLSNIVTSGASIGNTPTSANSALVSTTAASKRTARPGTRLNSAIGISWRPELACRANSASSSGKAGRPASRAIKATSSARSRSAFQRS